MLPAMSSTRRDGWTPNGSSVLASDCGRSNGVGGRDGESCPVQNSDIHMGPHSEPRTEHTQNRFTPVQVCCTYRLRLERQLVRRALRHREFVTGDTDVWVRAHRCAEAVRARLVDSQALSANGTADGLEVLSPWCFGCRGSKDVAHPQTARSAASKGDSERGTQASHAKKKGRQRRADWTGAWAGDNPAPRRILCATAAIHSPQALRWRRVVPAQSTPIQRSRRCRAR